MAIAYESPLGIRRERMGEKYAGRLRNCRVRPSARRSDRMNTTRPKGWSKTISDLLAENRNISGEEIEWARAYERDQLRTWARFPRPEEVYELLDDAEISFVTHWSAPFTGGGKGLLRKGSRVCIADPVSGPEPIGVYAEPLDKDSVESALVPEAERKAEDYAGFSLWISTAELNKLFRLVALDEQPD